MTLNAAQSQILDRMLALVEAAGPVLIQTDKYFTNTSRIVAAHGDAEVTFAVFMRRRVVAALEPVIRLVNHFVPDAKIKRCAEEGEVVPSELPAGRAAHLSMEGGFENLPLAWQTLFDWCKAEQLSPAGINWEIYGASEGAELYVLLA